MLLPGLPCSDGQKPRRRHFKGFVFVEILNLPSQACAFHIFPGLGQNGFYRQSPSLGLATRAKKLPTS